MTTLNEADTRAKLINSRLEQNGWAEERIKGGVLFPILTPTSGTNLGQT
jgi:hypothetical protein